MKKVLEDELMSLAHRILKLKNRAEIHELKEEAAVLYEKLSVLSFAEKHFDGAKPTIKKYHIEKSIEADHYNSHEESDYPDGTEYNEEQIYEHNTEKIKDIVSQMPYETEQVDQMFEDNIEEKTDKSTAKPAVEPEDRIEDFGVHFDDLPDFEPASDEAENANTEETDSDKNESDETSNENIKDEKSEPEDKNDKKDAEAQEKPQRTMDLFSQDKKSLNDSLNKDLKIGLNDRLSFIKHLFKGDHKSYDEFIVHINSLDSFEKVKSYLDSQIQEKYGYWKDKEDIANRLLYLIQKKFE
jgi:cobalamin biosynthesis protein CobT